MKSFNLLDLYAYELAPEVLNSLELLYFDSYGQLKQEHEATPEIEMEVKKEIDLDSIRNSLPVIVEPIKPRETTTPVDDQENSDLSDISETEASESEVAEEDDLYTRVEPQKEYNGDLDEVTVSYLNTKSPLLHFGSKLLESDTESFTVYKSLFSAREIKNPVQSLKWWNENNDAKKEQISALFMIGGGHFAGAIVSHSRNHVKKVIKMSEKAMLEQTVKFVEHKSVHRYTTRRKQGGSQSAMDDAKGKANSAGSSLRRYNEKALAEDVARILKGWEPYLERCKSIFIKANTQSTYSLLVNDEAGSVIHKNDPRVKKFPFTTARPKISELKKAWVELAYMNIGKLPTPDTKELTRRQRETELLSRSKQTKKSVEETKDTRSAEEKQTAELVAILKKSKAPALMTFVKRQKLDLNTLVLYPESKYERTPSALHFAAENGLHHMVYVLMNNLKITPCSPNSKGKVPWELAKDIQTRRAFQRARYRLGEDFCDWGKSKIGPALSEEQIEEMNNKQQKEKMDEMKQLLEEEKKSIKSETKKSHGHVLDPSNIDRQVLSGLSDMEKRRVESERRAQAIEARLARMRQSK